MRREIRYVTVDGKEFRDELEAQKHEDFLSLCEQISSLVPCWEYIEPSHIAEFIMENFVRCPPKEKV